MRNPFIPISMGLLCIYFTIIPHVQAGNNVRAAAKVSPSYITVPGVVVAEADDILYNNMQLHQYGLSREAFAHARKGYLRLLEKKLIIRTRYLTICDFSRSSKQKRFYVIDMDQNKLIKHTWVAHGKNSGGEFATRFSNTPESLQSSLGFYITAGTYHGEHGLSLRINGVDPGYNDQAMKRNIVLHGAAYVDAARAKAGISMGRSWGCPALPQNESTSIISTIKNGTCLFIYHPSTDYLIGSKILNG